MIKEIKYNGYSASPGDHEAVEGDLAVAMNLIPEHGTVRPVMPPRKKFSLPTGGTVMCIHKTTAYTYYIYYQAGNNSLYRLDEDGTVPYDGGHIHQFGNGVEIYKVEPIGNTLVVLASDGVHYILWKNGVYRHLGTHLPELDLSFSLIFYSVMASDQHEVDLENKHYVSAIRSDKDLKAKLCQAVLASANQASAKVCEKKCFAYPFFVRYAFRLYDGTSITMHSPPQLVVPTMEAPEVLMGWTVTPGNLPTVNENEAKVSAKINAYNLFHCALDSSQVDEVARWEDIISSVDVYISPLFYTYDQAIKDDEVDLFGDKVLPDKDITDAVRNNGTFHLIKSIKINDIFCGDGPASTSYGVNRPSQARPRANVNVSGLIVPDFEPTNDNIVVRELMSDDYGTHDELIADKSFAYNSRINLAGISKRLFNGFSPACMWAILAEQTPKQTTATVVIEDGGREIVVTRDDMSVYWNTGNTVVWFFYPNAGAKRAYLNIGGSKVMIELTVHPTLNGAYYYGLAGDAVQPVAVSSIPAPSADEQRVIDQPNKVYTSEVNNPFYFPVTGINSISSGNIMGICAAVRPVSTSQYGYADLYVFADNGVWTAKINDKGTYGNLDFATGDICINPDSITQLETSVLFSAARGIMLMSGSQAQCISEAIDDDGQPFRLGHPGVYNMADRLDLNVNVDSFKSFLPECRMLYDYTGQRIIVYNPHYNYAYIYSLESNKWGMMQSGIIYTVKSYPAALAVNDSNSLVDYGEPDSDVQGSAQMLITRPFALGEPDVIKTVTAVLQRGYYGRHSGRIESVLFASRDMKEWFLVATSRDENIRGFRGTGYQWFRIGLMLGLNPDESITGATIEYGARYTNRLR